MSAHLKLNLTASLLSDVHGTLTLVSVCEFTGIFNICLKRANHTVLFSFLLFEKNGKEEKNSASYFILCQWSSFLLRISDVSSSPVLDNKPFAMKSG